MAPGHPMMLTCSGGTASHGASAVADVYRGPDRRSAPPPTPGIAGRLRAESGWFGLALATIVALVLLSRDVPGVVVLASGVTACALSLVAAQLGWLAWRVSGSGAPAYAGAAVAVLGAVALPVATMSPWFTGPRAGLECARAIAVLLSCLLFARSATTTPVDTDPGFVRACVSAAALWFLAIVGPEPLRWPLTTDLALAVLTGVAALWFTTLALRRDRLLALRIGWGLATLAVAMVLRGLGEPETPRAAHQLTLHGHPTLTVLAALLRVVGVGWVVAGVVSESRPGLFGGRRDDGGLRLRMVSAEEHAHALVADRAELTHEVRTALVGVEGATAILASGDQGSPPHERAALARLVTAEVSRLQRMVSAPPLTAAPPAPDSSFVPADVLADLVLAERKVGRDVELQAEPAVTAAGSPDALVEAVSNLLVNAALHAPDAAVRVRVAGDGASVRIRVDDDGPGFPAGREALACSRGWRADTTGRGPGSGSIWRPERSPGKADPSSCSPSSLEHTS